MTRVSSQAGSPPGIKRLKRWAAKSFDWLAGNPIAERLATKTNDRRLRILAYHGVDDPVQFRAHMEHIRHNYLPVSADHVLASLDGEPLPPRSVWVTFDDGHPSVVDVGLSITARLEIPITLFLCPAVIDTATPLWWQSVIRSSPGSELLVRELKQAPDHARRETVAMMARRAREQGVQMSEPQLGADALRRLESAGATVGNHTWDHPTLDTCDVAEQERQITRADEYLRTWPALFRPVIAYPNGNWTPVAEATAARLGYRIGLLFDHALTDTSVSPLRWSRLRVGTSVSPGRFRSILAGLHPRLLRLRGLDPT